MFAGFYAFRQQAIIYVSMATFLSFIINFYIARKWGRGLVQKFVGQKGMENVDQFSQHYGLVSLFFARMFLGGIADFISYGAGLTKISFYPYLTVSTIGAIPGTILWYKISSLTNNPTLIILFSFYLVFGLGIFVISKINKHH